MGRRAYGPQRRMSPHIVSRNISESIVTHRNLGDDRPISFYTHDPNTQALVQAKLATLEGKADEAQLTMANPPHLAGQDSYAASQLLMAPTG